MTKFDRYPEENDKTFYSNNNIKHPYPQMEVGDSVIVFSEKDRAYAHNYGNNAYKKFITKKIGGNMFRVWRIA